MIDKISKVKNTNGLEIANEIVSKFVKNAENVMPI